MTALTYTKEQLTASDGRVWTQEEVELMAQWWESSGKSFHELDDILNQLWGDGGALGDWSKWEDPPAVELERKRIQDAREQGRC